MKQIALAAVALMTLSACATTPKPATQQTAFMANLNALCGQRFVGRVVTTDAVDADFASQRLLMHVRDCSAEEVRIPFWVGEDRSRTWVISHNEKGGLTLKHDHRDPQGNPDGLHWYGGDTTSAGHRATPMACTAMVATRPVQELPIVRNFLSMTSLSNCSTLGTPPFRPPMSGRSRSIRGGSMRMSCGAPTATSVSSST